MDLQRFCSKNPLRQHTIGRPFTQDGMTWATNGWVAIGVPVRADVQANPQAPSVASVRPKTEPETWFDIPAVEVEPCKICGGKICNFVCPECKGSGEVTLKSDFTIYEGVECGMCDGAGEPFVCKYCSETGVNADGLVTIGPAQFKANALWFIRDLPGIQISPTSQLGVAFLRFEGGEGLLMPGLENAVDRDTVNLRPL